MLLVAGGIDIIFKALFARGPAIAALSIPTISTSPSPGSKTRVCRTWVDGDFDYNDVVDPDDCNLFPAAFEN